jgi:hypothetical protein
MLSSFVSRSNFASDDDSYSDELKNGSAVAEFASSSALSSS